MLAQGAQIASHQKSHSQQQGLGFAGRVFAPILIPLWGSFEGHLQHLQALVYVRETLPHELQGFWVWPLVLQKNICNSVQGDHGVYFMSFTYVWAIHQLALILLKEKNNKFFIMCIDSYLVYCVATWNNCRGIITSCWEYEQVSQGSLEVLCYLFC